MEWLNIFSVNFWGGKTSICHLIPRSYFLDEKGGTLYDGKDYNSLEQLGVKVGDIITDRKGNKYIVYLLLISVFEIRILSIVFKYYNSSLYETNIEAYKTRFYQCALGLYIFLYLFLCISKLIITNFFSCFTLFFITWIFQIFYSAIKSIRPPMSYGLILATSLSKMFLPIYFKAYPNNAFEMKPDFAKSLSTAGAVVLEVFILFLQKAYGSKIFIPSYFKKNIYIWI